MQRPAESTAHFPATPVVDWRDSEARAQRSATSLSERRRRTGPAIKMTIRLAAVVMALTALASFFALSNRIPGGTALPESSLHLATLLAAQNRALVAKPAQAAQSEPTLAAGAGAPASTAPRPHLPIVRARGSSTSGIAERAGSSTQEDAGSAVIVRSQHGALQIRGEPDDNEVAIGSYAAGTPLTVIETAADWHRIVGPDGRWGWVRAAGLTEAAADSAKSKVRRIVVTPDRLPSSRERP